MSKDKPGLATVTRLFEFVDDSSSKFWEVTLNGSEFTVRFGKIGTAGQSKTKDAGSQEKALSEVDKLIREKTGKGYKEVGGAAPTPAVGSAKEKSAASNEAVGATGKTRGKAPVKVKKAIPEEILPTHAKKPLTLKVLESVDRGEHYFEKYDGITDAAAASLGQMKGNLRLSGLKSLSVRAAASLANVEPLKGEFNWIQLDSLSLTPEIAAGLAKYRGDQLVFCCPSIDLETIKAFRPFKGQLWLGKVTHLDDEIAAELAIRSGGAYLDAVKEYKATPGYLQLAKSLCKWDQSSWLGLRGAKTISTEALEIFATFNGVEILVSPEILKELKAQRRAKWKNSSGIKQPNPPPEWQGDRIVLSQGPANPLKGRKAERLVPSYVGISWWISQKVRSWFVQKLDAAHKTSVTTYDTGTCISPEAAKLLREHDKAWLWLMESKIRGAKEKEASSLKSLARIKPPKQFMNGKVSLPQPNRPVAKANCWKADFEEENYQSVLHYYSYLPENHVGSITDPNGFPAKAMSPEAADLYRQHRAFWEAKYAESKAQAKATNKARTKARTQVVKERLEKAAATAGLSKADLEAKLDRLAALAEKGCRAISSSYTRNWAKLDRLAALAEKDGLKLIADMVAGFGDPWLYQALLAGASITPNGDLKPGKVLKRFNKQAEFIMLLAVAYMPKGVEADPSIRRKAPIAFKVHSANVDVVAETIAPRLSRLKPDVWLNDLEILLPVTGQFLAQLKGDLDLRALTSLSDAAAQALAQHKGNLDLQALTSLNDAAAQFLAQHKGDLDLRALTSLNDAAARALGCHVGNLMVGIKDLTASIAEGLAATRGDLELPKLKTITPAAAAALASHSGLLTLGFNIYTEDLFDDPAFELGSEAAKCLASHVGPLALPSLKRIDAETALALSELNHYISADDLEEFPLGVGGTRFCERLAENPSTWLSFFHLKRLQPDCAAALAAFKGELRVSVHEWSDDTLIALSAHQGYLEINPKNISDEVGRALSRRSADSSMTIRGNVSLTDTAAEALSLYKGELGIKEYIEMSIEAAAYLVRRRSIWLLRSKLKSAVRKVFESAGTWSGSTWTRKA